MLYFILISMTVSRMMVAILAMLPWLEDFMAQCAMTHALLLEVLGDVLRLDVGLDLGELDFRWLDLGALCGIVGVLIGVFVSVIAISSGELGPCTAVFVV